MQLIITDYGEDAGHTCHIWFQIDADTKDVMQIDLLLKLLVFTKCVAFCHDAPPPLLSEALRTTGLQAKLFVIDLPVAPVGGDQILVRAAFHYATMLKHQNQVGILD